MTSTPPPGEASRLHGPALRLAPTSAGRRAQTARMWALALAGFRNHLADHGTAADGQRFKENTR